MNLDQIDVKILRHLQEKGRITNIQLSQKVGLSAAPTLERVKKLEKAGIIESYHAKVNPQKIGLGFSALISLSLTRQKDNSMTNFKTMINDIPEIVECYTVSGNFDYFLRVVCPDMDRYLELNDQLIESMEGVANINSHVVLATSKSFKGYALEKLVE